MYCIKTLKAYNESLECDIGVNGRMSDKVKHLTRMVS